MLGCFPRKSAEQWPPDAICEIIDSLQSDTILESFRSEIFNSRGVYGKAPYEGGGQERGLAAFFDTAAKRVEGKYPFTATALRDLAKGYQRDAKDEDENARLNELR